MPSGWRPQPPGVICWKRAARALEVDLATLEVDDGRIHSRATNRMTSYWELAEGKPFGIDIDPDAPLKPREALRHVGGAAVARDMEDIVRGRPYFLHDMTLPGMLHARVVRPPHYHARFRRTRSDGAQPTPRGRPSGGTRRQLPRRGR